MELALTCRRPMPRRRPARPGWTSSCRWCARRSAWRCASWPRLAGTLAGCGSTASSRSATTARSGRTSCGRHGTPPLAPARWSWRPSSTAALFGALAQAGHSRRSELTQLARARTRTRPNGPDLCPARSPRSTRSPGPRAARATSTGCCRWASRCSRWSRRTRRPNRHESNALDITGGALLFARPRSPRHRRPAGSLRAQPAGDPDPRDPPGDAGRVAACRCRSRCGAPGRTVDCAHRRRGRSSSGSATSWAPPMSTTPKRGADPDRGSGRRGAAAAVARRTSSRRRPDDVGERPPTPSDGPGWRSPRGRPRRGPPHPRQGHPTTIPGTVSGPGAGAPAEAPRAGSRHS